jgi:alkylhydroperoxidase family enzyme
MSMRQAVARQSGFTEDLAARVANYENEDLPGVLKAALRLADAWLSAPADMSPALIDDVRTHLTQEEIVDLITELWKNSRNKMYVAFGMGPAIDADRLTYVQFDHDTGKILTVAESGTRAV